MSSRPRRPREARPRKVYPTVAVGQTWARAGTQPKTVRIFEVDGHYAGLIRADTGRHSHMTIHGLQRRFRLVEEASDA